ncbi:phage terminase large subunit family protein [Paenibacillus crassostreae]|uniref:Terminase n=1 Tax=Paenibacillus crassostreae TaxID=1763538 RepID=A0A162RKU5_9BACL|nr:phage terminase large subunit family protein [Paenibacillus crassostreae]AOZ91639.1 terminase [Paenibacillus crassostreae]OAB72787.1 terminase [Paenibacillus crassostreae]
MKEQKKQTLRLLQKVVRLVAPPEPMSVADWADKHRILSPESSSEPGQWRTDRAPYQRVPMEATSDLEINTIVMMWASQTGKSDFQNNVAGYYTGHEPAPIMMVQPTLVLAKEFSKDRLAPMYRDSKQLNKLVTSRKTKDSSNTLLYKSFPGGRINLAGANSPASLASKPIRILLCDEIDRYPVSAGVEGDPVNLATVRTKTFPNRKIILVSTPTIKGASRIESAYQDSSMEEWCVPCPSCEEYQPFKWAQIKFEYNKETNTATKVEHACKSCGALHAENEWKKDYAKRAKWIAQREHKSTRGFHLNELASTFSNWFSIVEDFKKADRGGKEMLKTFFNTSMAESWEEKGEQMDSEILLNRREMYHSDIPEGVKVLTAAVDTQDNRFEVEVQGWGKDHESWRIQYQVIYGDLKQSQVWNDLDEFLKRTWEDAEGRKFKIALTCMDSGGHFTGEVYKFCKARSSRRVFAIKGEASGDGTYKPLINGTSTNNRYRATVVRLGVDEGKSKVMSALKIPLVDEYGDKPQGYCHFPLTTKDNNRGYNQDYFDGLTAEAMQKRVKNGVPYYVWVKVRTRNEPLDLAVYNRAAIEILNPNLDADLPVIGVVSTSGSVPSKPRRRGTKSSV